MSDDTNPYCSPRTESTERAPESLPPPRSRRTRLLSGAILSSPFFVGAAYIAWSGLVTPALHIDWLACLQGSGLMLLVGAAMFVVGYRL